MRRRGVGVGAVQKTKQAQEKYLEKKTQIETNLMQELTKQMEQFKDNLETFAKKHQKSIKKDPDFRHHFMQMCATIGVDPMVSSKGFWSVLGLGSFYTQLAVQAVEVVLASTKSTGGIMTLGELHSKLNKSKTKVTEDISCADVLRAVKSLEVLGKTCGVIKADKLELHLIYCVPEELSLDNTTVMQYAVRANTYYVSLEEIVNALGWKQERAETVIHQLVRERIVWIDIYKGNKTYWFPSLYFSTDTENFMMNA